MPAARRFTTIVGPVALGLLALSAGAQTPLKTLLVDVDHRASTSLNGDWHYIVDMPGRGLYSAGGKINDNGYGLNVKPSMTVGGRVQEYDFSTAPTLKVPGDWNTQEPTLFRYEGIVWYQRDFPFQPRAGMRTFLHVGAANYRSYVWVNGKRICDHEGGYTPYDCEVTGTAHAGNNFVVIAVDSARIADGIPGLDVDWYNYGGLTRDVSLVEVPKAFIDDFDIHLKKGTTDTLSGYVHVEGGMAGSKVTVGVPEAELAASVTTDATGRAPFEMKAATLALWSPGAPKLYKVELTAGTDALTDDVGFRDIRVEGTRILLNGKAVFLQGANAHAEAPIRGGRVTNQTDVDNIFGYLKDLDANFVRLCHYPQDERMERTADRRGIMVWSEIPIWQHITYEKPEVYAKAVAMLGEMIRRDRNKASVILWSVSNETPDNPVRTKFLTNLANEARHMDDTRLITSALLQPKTVDGIVKQNDPFTAALDVIGQNEYVGWYSYRAEEADALRWELPQKPVIMSEFGAEAKFGHHGGKDERWTEEQQVNFFEHNFVMLSHIPQVRGFAPWVLADFRSPTRNIPGLQDGFNRKGLVSDKGEKKPAFYVVKKIYDEGRMGKAE